VRVPLTAPRAHALSQARKGRRGATDGGALGRHKQLLDQYKDKLRKSDFIRATPRAATHPSQDGSPITTPRAAARPATPRCMAARTSTGGERAASPQSATGGNEAANADAVLLQARLDSHAALARRALQNPAAQRVASLRRTPELEAASGEDEVEHAIALLRLLLEIEASHTMCETHIVTPPPKVQGAGESNGAGTVENGEMEREELERKVAALTSRCFDLEQELRTSRKEIAQLRQHQPECKSEPDAAMQTEVVNHGPIPICSEAPPAAAKEAPTPRLAPAFAKSSRVSEMVAKHAQLTNMAKQEGWTAPLDMKIVDYTTRTNVPKNDLAKFQPDTAMTDQSIDSLIEPPVFAAPGRTPRHKTGIAGQRPFNRQGDSYKGGPFDPRAGAGDNGEEKAESNGSKRGGSGGEEERQASARAPLRDDASNRNQWYVGKAFPQARSPRAPQVLPCIKT